MDIGKDSQYDMHQDILRYSTQITENVKNRAEIQVAEHNLDSLNTSHRIILIIQQKNQIETIQFKISFPVFFGTGKLPNTLM